MNHSHKCQQPPVCLHSIVHLFVHIHSTLSVSIPLFTCLCTSTVPCLSPFHCSLVCAHPQYPVCLHSVVHLSFICAHPQYWETDLAHELPINNADTGNSICPKAFKNMFSFFVGVVFFFFLMYVYLFITKCVI